MCRKVHDHARALVHYARLLNRIVSIGQYQVVINSNCVLSAIRPKKRTKTYQKNFVGFHNHFPPFNFARNIVRVGKRDSMTNMS